MKRLSIYKVGTALAIALGVTFIACVVWDAVFPSWKMYPAWQAMLPGFDWISVGDFFLGLVETVLFGYWAALVFVPAYNYVSRGHSEGSVTSSRSAPRVA